MSVAVRVQALVVALLACLGGGAAAASWVYSDGAPVPAGTLRVTTLGSGTPDVRRHQVRTLVPARR